MAAQNNKYSLLTIRNAHSYVHRFLAWFSKHYQSWFGLVPDTGISPLPFGLLLKWHEHVRVEEAFTMRLTRAAGMPVPYVLCCGEQPPPHWYPVSILMTRLPGFDLANCGDPFIPEDEEPWISEVQRCVDAMRAWSNPFGQRICSAMGSAIASHRVPFHKMGPLENEAELNKVLLGPASKETYMSKGNYEDELALAQEMEDIPHDIVFTHGDFKAHNLLLDEIHGKWHLTGFLDWECAGWCPAYWEFTTVLTMHRRTWWGEAVRYLGGDRYQREYRCEEALRSLTVDSYVG
ncbi:uncharacterized protein KY384_000829 [Bacidia gigantensis]|uniref:uncharacterized protein n=1 Tax=Bacidia gigantensis TaxID=2732470 RepID=UPI001D04D6A8|nr:uncharacterized protein KY384_000821 [Bacidia gigantensis]XP_044665350.1 uncharacterized protein KY384_000829 [Bacidia gigantensis]KAG8526059.1 hypothetical protein KY384_000821 [Bacidia gigantensis]KAG8526067.1 hypothetical protein KY384_000829 [Bacidia gigantensis]